MKKQVVIIIDAYGPARYFLNYLKNMGFLCVHLLSTPKPLPRLSLSEIKDYDFCLTHHGDIQETIHHIESTLQQINGSLSAALPGTEPGVLLADALSHHFALPNNGLEKSLARRDKSQMFKIMSENKLNVPQSAVLSSVSEALDFFKQQASSIVLKPLDSAGTNGVHFCHSEEDIKRAFYNIMGAENNMGIVNTNILAQQLLRGREYMINTVSCGGQHYITDIHLAEKKEIKDFANIYDRNILLDSHSEEYGVLRDYVFQVLDAFDITIGPTHCEVMLTDKGPYLIELGARVGGNVNIEFNQMCLGHNQVEITLDSYFRKEHFLQYINRPYTVNNFGMQIVLASPMEGIIQKFELEKLIQSLPSLVCFNLKPYKKGDFLHKTFDLSSSLGMVHLASKKEAEIFKDYETLQDLLSQYVIV